MKKYTINEWLNNEHDFISNCNFPDLYYLKELGKRVSYFLKSIPIPVLTTYDPLHYRIYFKVGNEKKGFEIDVDTSYYDFTTVVERWLIQFYPQYEVDVEKVVEYSAQDILQLREEALKKNEKFDTHDYLDKEKVITTKECGIIERILLKSDEFIFNLNGNKFVRLSGAKGNLLPLSQFLKEIRSLPFITIKDYLTEQEIDFKDDDNLYVKLKNSATPEKYVEIRKVINNLIKAFVEQNSKEVIPINEVKKDIKIAYEGRRMFNFFKINYSDLKDYELEQIGNNEYRWSNFLLFFDEESVKSDCLTFYRSMKGE